MLKNLHWNKTLKRPGAAKGPSHCNYCCNYENCNIEFVELNNYDPPFAAFQDAANQYAINWIKPPLFMSHSPVGHKSTVSKLAEYYPNKIFKPVGSEVWRTCISKSLSNPNQPGRLALNLAPFGRTCPIHTKVICGHDNISVAKIIFDPSCKSRHFDTNVTLLWKCRDKIVTPI